MGEAHDIDSTRGRSAQRRLKSGRLQPPFSRRGLRLSNDRHGAGRILSPSPPNLSILSPQSSLHALLLLVWRWRYVLTAVAVLLFGSLGYVFYGGELRFLPDERDYFEISSTLASDGQFGHNPGQPTADRAPGYVWFLASLFLFHKSIALAQMVQVGLWGITALFAARVAAQLSGPAAGGAVLIGALVYPLFGFTALTIYPQTLIGFLLVAALSFTFRLGERMGLPEIILFGAVLALLALTNPIVIVLIPIILAAAIRQRRISLMMAAVPLAIVVFGLAGWTYRNYVAIDAPIPTIATNSGLNLLLGNSENVEPGLGTRVDLSNYVQQTAGLNEVEQDRFLRNAAIDWIRDHPVDAATLYVRKFISYFSYEDKLETESESSSLRSLGLFVTYYAILALALSRLLLIKRAPLRWEEILLLVLYVTAALAYSVFFNRIRFRAPFDYLPLILAAMALVEWLRRPDETESQRDVVPVA